MKIYLIQICVLPCVDCIVVPVGMLELVDGRAAASSPRAGFLDTVLVMSFKNLMFLPHRLQKAGLSAKRCPQKGQYICKNDPIKCFTKLRFTTTHRKYKYFTSYIKTPECTDIYAQLPETLHLDFSSLSCKYLFDYENVFQSITQRKILK